MDIVVPQIGIDVSKGELMVSIDQKKPFAQPNTSQGCLEIIKNLPLGGVVHLEATGSYERLVQRMLIKHGFKVVIHNPLKSHRMSQALGTKAKTDPVDAKSLSRTGPLLPQNKAKSTRRQDLADFSRIIDVLKDMVKALKQRNAMPERDAAAKQLLEETLLVLKQKIEAAEKDFEARVKASEYAQTYKLIQSVPSLGKLTARRCVCEFPEDIMERTPSQIACYAGLAPMDHSSGKRTGRSHLSRGNSRIKSAFFMPAMCAIRWESWAKDLYSRLRAEGRTHQGALVAIMRRLLLRAVAVTQRGTPWQAVPPMT